MKSFQRLAQIITINDIRLPFCQNVSIRTTRNGFTDTAEISLPNRINQKGERISDLVPLGSPIIVKLGYFPDVFVEFEGYVSQIIPDKTLTIRCENESYNLKKNSIGRDIILASTTLRKLISEIYDRETLVADANIGNWRVSRTSTVIDVLSELQSKFKIYSYFRGDTLIVGANADTREKKNVIVDFQNNVPIGESNLDFKNANSDRIVVKATNIKRDGTIIEIYAYYDGNPAVIVFSKVAPVSGSVNEFNVAGTNISVEDLKNLAKTRLQALSFTGVDGSVTIYGDQQISHGDIAVVKDRGIPERDGSYSIVEIVKRFGVGVGYRLDLGLGLSL